MKYIIPFLLTAFLISCSAGNNEADKENQEDVAGENEPASTDETSADKAYITFDKEKFSSPKTADLLKELKICNPTQKNLNNASEPACDPKFFHIQPFNESIPVENAFLLVIRTGVHDWPLRRVLVYQREQGKLVLVNTFVANLIGTRQTSKGAADLVLRFQDEDQNMFNCIYRWKENRYQFSSVETINESKIKAGLQDSMNIEIAKVIADYKMSS